MGINLIETQRDIYKSINTERNAKTIRRFNNKVESMSEISADEIKMLVSWKIMEIHEN